ncbi:MAG: hypothetical protein K2Q10_12590 [Rhodospirillales bacterium]|nr:hypothetical protein [Rhodospirillales bacterium]
MDEIAIPELVALALEALASGAAGDDAVTAMARIAGLGRLRAASRTRLETALRLAVEKKGHL